jgi:puromycin-sensitive aminopeptidase
VLSGDVAAVDFVELVSRLGEETEPAVWSAALSGLSELDRVVSSDDRPWLQRRVRDLVSPAVDRVGWEPGPGESDLERQLRGVLIGALGNLGADAGAQAMASDVFEQWLDDRSSVDGNVGAAVLSVVAGNGSAREFDRLIGLYERASNPQDEIRFLRAAASVPDLESAHRAIDMVISGEVRSQDALSVIARAIGHRDIGAAAWERVKERWDQIIDVLPPQTARHMIDLVIYRSEPTVAADIEQWLDAHPLPGGDMYVPQQIERMRVRVGLRERESRRLTGAE